MSDIGRPAPSFRLRGEVGGALRSYAIRAGENWIGSTSGNNVVLPVRGVSRRHALVKSEPEGLALEDVGSKNGTLVNGVRVQRTQLQAGDEIRLGPVTLRLEAVDPEDAALAISLDGARPAVAGLPQQDTTAASAREPGRIGLDLAEGLICRLTLTPEPDLDGLVALLGRELQAQSACVVELRGGEPIALAASGALPDLAGHRAFQEFERAAASAPGGNAVATLPGDPSLTCAIAAGPGTERLGLVVAGPLRVARGEAEALLRILLGLARRLRPGVLAAAAASRAEEHGLVFPEGYVSGESPAMRAFHSRLRTLVQGDLPALLLGETGVGKECLARTLHLSSPRRSRGPFVAVNCAAIPSELLEAEMFGVTKGAATGVAERKGSFQKADGGTLFLDEIGDMPLELQAKLLRALQEKEVQPVGGSPMAVDLRVVSATNSDLARRIEAGRFRRDLYFRLAGFALSVPALRERREDIPVLVHAFLRSFSQEAGKAVRGITVKALRALIEYDWPGNVRELEHEVRRLVYLCPEGEAVDSAMLSLHLLATRPVLVESPADSLDLEKNVDAVERRLIQEALARAAGNRTRAAKLLRVSRNGLANKMERLGLS